jgi:hypothetical protein
VALDLTPAETEGVLRDVAALWGSTPWVVLLGDSGADRVRGTAYTYSTKPEYVGVPSNGAFPFEVVRERGVVEVRSVASPVNVPPGSPDSGLWDWNDGDPRPPYTARLAGWEAVRVLLWGARVDANDAEIREWWVRGRTARDRFDAAGEPVDAAIRSLWTAATGKPFPDREARALAYVASLIAAGAPAAGRTLGEIYADVDPRLWFGPARRDFRLPDDFRV